MVKGVTVRVKVIKSNQGKILIKLDQRIELIKSNQWMVLINPNQGHRRVTRGAGMSGGVWRASGAGGGQVGGASHQERRWGAGEN